MCLRWLYHHMLAVPYISRESWVLCLLLLCRLMMCANNRIHYDLMGVLVCLHIALPHYVLSQGVELLKCLSGNSVSSVCLRLNKFSQLSSMQYMGLCVSILPISHMMIVRIRVLDHHQIGSVTHLPLFMVRSWNGLRCKSFYTLIRPCFQHNLCKNVST